MLIWIKKTSVMWQRSCVAGFLPFLLLMGSVFILMSCAITPPDFKSEEISKVSKTQSYRMDALSPESPVIQWKKNKLENAWWKSFRNATINQWVDKALRQSPSAAAAIAALQQAKAINEAKLAPLYPSVAIKGGISRQKSKTNPTQDNASTREYTLHNASVNVNYQFDLAGGSSYAKESYDAQLNVQRWQTFAAFNMLAANVTTAAIKLSALQAQMEDTERLLALQEEQLSKTEQLRKIGTLSDADVFPLRASVANTQATLPALHKQRVALENQLSVLLGEFPEQSSIKSIVLSHLKVPQQIPLWLPSALIRRRPDIQAAEAQWRQAAAAIGVAQAAFFPTVGISGALSFQAVSLAKLLNTSLWSMAASMTQSLFRGGALSAQKAQADAGYRLAQARYQSVILNSFANVSNSLVSLEADRKILMAQNKALQAAERAYTLVRKKYQIGSSHVYDLLNAERTYQQAKIAQIRSQADQLTNIVALYLAAGGNVDFQKYYPDKMLASHKLVED